MYLLIVHVNRFVGEVHGFPALDHEAYCVPGEYAFPFEGTGRSLIIMDYKGLACGLAAIEYIIRDAYNR